MRGRVGFHANTLRLVKSHRSKVLSVPSGSAPFQVLLQYSLHSQQGLQMPFSLMDLSLQTPQAERYGFTSQLSHFLAVRTCPSASTSVSFSFSICKMGKIRCPFHWVFHMMRSARPLAHRTYTTRTVNSCHRFFPKETSCPGCSTISVS